MGAVTLDQEISVVFAGTIAFGVYFATLLSCYRWLLFADEGWKLRKIINWPLVLVAFLIFGCNLSYLVWCLWWTEMEARHVINDPPGPPFAVPDYANIVSCTLANGNVLLGDMVLIHRCWVVHGKRKLVIIIPVFLWLVALLCTLLQIYLQSAHAKNPNIGPYTWASVNMTLGPGIVLLPFWISTVLLNAYASGALIIRIYQVARQYKITTSETTYLHFFVRIIAESGLLYLSITLAHFLVWFGSSKFAIDVISVLNAPIVGIAFNWFLIRVATNKAEAARAAPLTHRKISTLKFNHPSTTRQETGLEDNNFSTLSAGAAFEVVIASQRNSSSGGASKEETASSGTIEVVGERETV